MRRTSKPLPNKINLRLLARLKLRPRAAAFRIRSIATSGSWMNPAVAVSDDSVVREKEMGRDRSDESREKGNRKGKSVQRVLEER
ncbi:unnamed protein product [Dovyalis caffra]|uniref:Uncharacterized protein n=1 Tax=Dovyalis caffra TaxID=77055 RepID=A0AAV1S0J2_9ROSI|nr:unnamed protein product [Dovyalis caffra]